MTKNPELIGALETVAESTDVPVAEIIDLLTGFCWDEEEAGELKEDVKLRFSSVATINNQQSNSVGSNRLFNNLKQKSKDATTTGTLTGIITIGGVVASSLIPVFGTIVVIPLGVVGAIATSHQLVVKIKADHKIDILVQKLNEAIETIAKLTAIPLDEIIDLLRSWRICKLSKNQIKNHLH
jgi:hypothetical protein